MKACAVQKKYWEPRKTLKGQGNSVHFVTFSPDGRTLASGIYPIIFWDAQTGDLRRVIDRHGTATYLAHFAFSPDGRMLAGCRDSFIDFLDLHQTLRFEYTEPKARYPDP